MNIFKFGSTKKYRRPATLADLDDKTLSTILDSGKNRLDKELTFLEIKEKCKFCGSEGIKKVLPEVVMDIGMNTLVLHECTSCNERFYL